MKKPRIENKCTNCVKRLTCRMGRGVVVWKHCDKFKVDTTGMVREVKNEKTHN